MLLLLLLLPPLVLSSPRAAAEFWRALRAAVRTRIAAALVASLARDCRAAFEAELGETRRRRWRSWSVAAGG